jgi:precorrin-6B methylase 2
MTSSVRRYSLNILRLAGVAACVGFLTVAVAGQTGAGAGQAQQTQGQKQKPFEPYSGQPGKDVVWVPTPQVLVDRMLDMAKVTAADYVMDLGSGDGRTVITAAKRGATAVGIEYNPDMVELSKKNAIAAGVNPAKASFIQADLFKTDLSKATVITMFLLPSINMQLRPTILDLKPGTRVVSNSFTMEDWEADETSHLTEKEKCEGSWCTAYFWVVPAKVEGAWKVGANSLTLTQKFQMLTGSLGSNTITNGRMRGAQISFSVAGVKYTGTVDGSSMKGTMSGGQSWTATK